MYMYIKYYKLQVVLQHKEDRLPMTQVLRCDRREREKVRVCMVGPLSSMCVFVCVNQNVRV